MEPSITVRFNNPRFDTTTKKYRLDVEYLSDTENQRIFGTNVRFFYDATVFLPNNVLFTDFAAGYGMQNKASMGTAPIGISWFGLKTAPVTYVNWAIQLNQPASTPIIVSTNPFEWTKLFSIEVTAKDTVNCPSFIWDKKTDPIRGGFMVGSDGVCVTAVTDPTGIILTHSTAEYTNNFNWTATQGKFTPPYGQPNLNNCQ